MHPDLEPLAFLAGRWRGTGEGVYPTIDPFRYGEEISYTAPPGKPFLAYAQRTWALPGEEPLHTEAGYLRPGGPAGPELLVAQYMPRPYPTNVILVQNNQQVAYQMGERIYEDDRITIVKKRDPVLYPELP